MPWYVNTVTSQVIRTRGAGAQRGPWIRATEMGGARGTGDTAERDGCPRRGEEGRGGEQAELRRGRGGRGVGRARQPGFREAGAVAAAASGSPRVSVCPSSLKYSRPCRSRGRGRGAGGAPGSGTARAGPVRHRRPPAGDRPSALTAGARKSRCARAHCRPPQVFRDRRYPSPKLWVLRGSPCFRRPRRCPCARTPRRPRPPQVSLRPCSLPPRPPQVSRRPSSPPSPPPAGVPAPALPAASPAGVRAQAMVDVLGGRRLLTRDGAWVEAEEELQNKVVALYFAAGWCAPSRDFTPLLCHFYAQLVAEARPPAPFAVVFVSADGSAQEMLDFMRELHGAWLALPFHDPFRQ